eukprot:13027676-Heterocapsa_arctica.AAC.1
MFIATVAEQADWEIASSCDRAQIIKAGAMEKLIENKLMFLSSCTEVKIGTAILAVLITAKCGTKEQKGVETEDHCGECERG